MEELRTSSQWSLYIDELMIKGISSVESLTPMGTEKN